MQWREQKYRLMCIYVYISLCLYITNQKRWGHYCKYYNVILFMYRIVNFISILHTIPYSPVMIPVTMLPQIHNRWPFTNWWHQDQPWNGPAASPVFSSGCFCGAQSLALTFRMSHTNILTWIHGARCYNNERSTLKYPWVLTPWAPVPGC